MKTIFNTLFITAAAVFAFSCEKPANDNITPSEENLVELTLTVGADTKTQLGGENNTSIIWQENDKLIVFDGTANREFAIKDFEPGKNSAVFTGLALPAEKYYVVHSTAEGSEPVFTVPNDGDPYVTGILVANVQKAVKGSYDPSAFASVGIAEVKEGETDLSVQMRNTCSLVKVSLKSSDIKTIEISTTDENKYLTAKCKYTFKEYPAIAAQSDRYLSAVLDSESAMEPGDYYIAILPRELNNLTVTYTKADGSTASVTATGTYNFNRSDIVPLGIDDSALEFPNENEPEELVLTVDFTSQPFTTDLPTSKNALSNVDFVLSQNEAEYTFTINSPKGKNCILLGEGQGFRMNADGSSNACYVKLPALEGLKLTSVYVKVSNTPGTGKKLYVNTTNDQATAPIMVSVADNDGDANITAVEAQEYTFELSDSSAGTQYWLCSPAKATTFTTWVLTYSE